MSKRQDTPFSPTTTPNNSKKIPVITAILIGFAIGIIFVIVCYTFIPRFGSIDRFLRWWYFTRHRPPPPPPSLPPPPYPPLPPPPPYAIEGQEQNPTTANMPTTQNNNNNNHGDDGIQHSTNGNNNNNNNNNDIELTDFITNTAPPNNTQN